MTQKELISLIKHLIRKELAPVIKEAVEKAVSNEFHELKEALLSPATEDFLTDTYEPPVGKNFKQLVLESDDEPIINKQRKKIFKGNDPISQALNMTRGGIVHEYATMTGGGAVANPINPPVSPEIVQALAGRSKQVLNASKSKPKPTIQVEQTDSQLSGTAKRSVASHYEQMMSEEGGGLTPSPKLNVINTPTHEGGEVPMNPDTVPDVILNIMNKDYSQVMKKMKEKTGR